MTVLSGRRGSNPQPIAWKAIALPIELLPHVMFKTFQVQNVQRYTPLEPLNLLNLLNFKRTVGRSGFEPLKSKDSGFTVRPIWPLWNLPFGEIPKAKNQIPNVEICDLRVCDLEFHRLSRRRESNPRPADYKSAALPTELLRLLILNILLRKM